VIPVPGPSALVAALADLSLVSNASTLKTSCRRPDSENLKHAFLVTAVSAGGGAVRKVPRALGQAFTAFGRGELNPDWRSSDGLERDRKAGLGRRWQKVLP